MGITTKEKGQGIPKLYATEGIPLKDKTIHEHWLLPSCDFHWLIAEFDPEEKLAFGYANLDDDQNAEWGYISIAEIERNGAGRDKDFKPAKFKDVIDSIIRGETDAEKEQEKKRPEQQKEGE